MKNSRIGAKPARNGSTHMAEQNSAIAELIRMPAPTENSATSAVAVATAATANIVLEIPAGTLSR